MPFQGSFEVEAGKTWGYYEPSTRYILDSFNRSTTSGTLGISTNGQMWNTLTGNWYVNSSYQAENDNGVTSGTGPYPLATYDLVDTNQLGYANVSPGMGIAFSIQNSGNWYAIASYDYDTPYSCSCGTCSYCNTCTYGCISGCNAAECGTYTCNTGYTQSSSRCGCPSNCSYIGLSYYEEYLWSCANFCTYSCTTGVSCSACGETYYSCNCSTCYDYYYYLTVLQSINGTVYTLSTATLTQDPASISVQLKNGVVSYYAYSTNVSGIITTPYGLGTALASGTLTISGTFGTQIGMVKSPSYYIQGATISGFFGTGL
jgi:hypothetical protein